MQNHASAKALHRQTLTLQVQVPEYAASTQSTRSSSYDSCSMNCCVALLANLQPTVRGMARSTALVPRGRHFNARERFGSQGRSTRGRRGHLAEEPGTADPLSSCLQPADKTGHYLCEGLPSFVVPCSPAPAAVVFKHKGAAYTNKVPQKFGNVLVRQWHDDFSLKPGLAL